VSFYQAVAGGSFNSRQTSNVGWYVPVASDLYVINTFEKQSEDILDERLSWLNLGEPILLLFDTGRCGG
jgi:hypothetical protein